MYDIISLLRDVCIKQCLLLGFTYMILETTFEKADV